ncbi:AAA family ATPase [Sphingomonas echinoides]|uniref:AAA family ATPase n=1 Tax=Sphingomonas echinoides TaxID=59803 RepID=UPI00241391A7|nr:AAA family ATPase [Sphingomonas echinoides]
MSAVNGKQNDPMHSDRRTAAAQAAPPRHWDSQPETDKWLASHHFEDATPTIPFRIDGWLAARGPAVWFGAGSTGKTQLLLWMAAMIASRPEHRQPTWLGGTINGTGHVLILTAEDARSQIVGRLRDIVQNTMHQDTAAAASTCARLHVMPFLSMTEAEFGHPNASLLRFGEDRVWRPSGVMEEVRRYITEWNARHDDPEDRIVGVVMDSATSMAGFDGMEGEATTNFFFYLGRLCEALGIFFTIIGHVPKAAFVPRKDPWGSAASRLRGVAMWTTAPRMAVEVRLLQEWREKGGPYYEEEALRDLFPHLDRKDFLVIYAAKANLLGVCREPRYIIRDEQGAFREVSPPVSVDSDAAGDDKPSHPSLRKKPKAPRPASARSDRSKRSDEDYAPGTELVMRVITLTYPDLVAGQCVAADRVMKKLITLHAEQPFPNRELVTSASGGGKRKARDGSIAWHFQRLEKRGVLEKRNSRHFFVHRPTAQTDGL